MILTCLIIDNDPLNIKILENYINKTERIKLIDKSADLLDLVQIINAGQVHIVFMDINIDGIENWLLDDIFQKDITYVFVTKYPREYIADILPDGFSNSGYLFKPVSFTLFTQEINRIRKLYVPSS